jgi:hypothetical protein
VVRAIHRAAGDRRPDPWLPAAWSIIRFNAGTAGTRKDGQADQTTRKKSSITERLDPKQPFRDGMSKEEKTKTLGCG